jgi:hypothetical protein
MLRQTIDEKTVKIERKKDYKITQIDRFKYRTRYFSDSGIIGTKYLKHGVQQGTMF